MAAAPLTAASDEVLAMLKVDGKGWNIALFVDTAKASASLCERCKSICCESVELGCDHEDDEIFFYCSQCLQAVIDENNGQCPINNHSEPIIAASRGQRRTISKLTVMCPFSSTYKARCNAAAQPAQEANNNNNNGVIMDTLMANDEEEKEGGDVYNVQEMVAVAANHVNDDNDNINNGGRVESDCEWRGTFKQLLNVHIMECVKKNDPSLVYKQEIEKLKRENQGLEHRVNALQNELNEKTIQSAQKENKLNVQIMALSDTVNEYKQTKERVENENNELKSRIAELSQSNDVLKATNQRLKHQLEQMANDDDEKKEEEAALNEHDAWNLTTTATKKYEHKYSSVLRTIAENEEEEKVMMHRVCRSGNKYKWRFRIEQCSPIKSEAEYKYSSDFDTSGIVYALATNGGNTKWINPAKTQKIKVTAKSTDWGSWDAILGREDAHCFTKNEKNSWLCIDFGDLRIKPTMYTLRHNWWNGFCLRSWNFEGSVDGTNWKMLRRHTNDTALDDYGQSASWSIQQTNGYFSKFRIYMTGRNSGLITDYVLCLGGFEIYGFVLSAECENNVIGMSAVNEEKKKHSISYSFISNLAVFSVKKNGEEVERREYGAKCKQGDEIEMSVDLQANQLSFGINNKHYGVATKVDANTKYAAFAMIKRKGNGIAYVQ